MFEQVHKHVIYGQPLSAKSIWHGTCASSFSFLSLSVQLMYVNYSYDLNLTFYWDLFLGLLHSHTHYSDLAARRVRKKARNGIQNNESRLVVRSIGKIVSVASYLSIISLLFIASWNVVMYIFTLSPWSSFYICSFSFCDLENLKASFNPKEL
jgi:hypothetical protein